MNDELAKELIEILTQIEKTLEKGVTAKRYSIDVAEMMK